MAVPQIYVCSGNSYTLMITSPVFLAAYVIWLSFIEGDII